LKIRSDNRPISPVHEVAGNESGSFHVHPYFVRAQ
jgi:hypothetical protein